MRTLAIDLGSRRVGLALSDEGGKFATPHGVLNVQNADQAFKPIHELIQREGIQRVIIGLPLDMDGTLGPAAKSVIQWGSTLQSDCDIELHYVDERLSTFEADQRLTDRKRLGEKLTRSKKKDRLDAQAAAIFLQEFLDGKIQPAIVSSR